MWELTINGVDLYHIINWFFIYSFLGWVWETFYVSIKHGEFINRGFINGPFCTIYGFGAISVYLILKPIEDNLLFLFLGGIVVATLLEYITAVLMESIFHTSWWDYSDNKFNFQGRICWSISGLGSVHSASVSSAASFCRRFGCLLPGNGRKNRCVCDFCWIFGNFSCSAAAAFHLKERIPYWEEELEKKQVELMLKVNARLENLELPKGVSLDSVRERMESQKCCVH